MKTKILFTAAALIFSAVLFAAGPMAPPVNAKAPGYAMHTEGTTKFDGERHGAKMKMKKAHGKGKLHKGDRHEHKKCCHHHGKGKHKG